MQFLFMMLMSVLVAGSALPHVLQAPNRPSFSIRKSTAFSLIALPHFIQRVSKLESDLQKKAKMRTLASLEQKKQIKKEEEALEELESIEVETPPDEIVEVGTITVKADRLTSCICQEAKMLRCQLSIEGECSHTDESIILTERSEEVGERIRGINCKDDNTFENTFILRGNGIVTITLEHLGTQVEAKYNLMNECGSLEDKLPEPSEEAIKTRRKKND